ncbi:MAG TPA: PhoH family protein [Cytophagaceae bacterium]|nr:PhoH family protein [Cytophagaceae bacterium]
MAEKIITLEDISLIDLLGIENSHLKQVATAFPKTKIVSRGNELKLIGSDSEIIQIAEIVNSLTAHYNRYGAISDDKLKSIINREPEPKAEEIIDDVILFGDKGLIIKPKTDNQKKLVATHFKNDLVFAVGPAGTGKTYISVALAVRALKNKEVKKIVITRPAVEAGESLGFLPGDLKEKVDPYLRPIYDALDDMVTPDKLKYYYENRIIEIAPLAFMRGRTLHNAFILLDEAQNTTAMQMKMFLTRMGPSSKMIVTGDQSQVDLPGRQQSGLIECFKLLQNIPGIGFVELTSKDVMRHKLVERIINAYERNNTTHKEKK